jgi:CRISPR/Cas system CSM-associated protein Csm2 small subunit
MLLALFPLTIARSQNISDQDAQRIANAIVQKQQQQADAERAARMKAQINDQRLETALAAAAFLKQNNVPFDGDFRSLSDEDKKRLFQKAFQAQGMSWSDARDKAEKTVFDLNNSMNVLRR